MYEVCVIIKSVLSTKRLEIKTIIIFNAMTRTLLTMVIRLA